VSAPARRYGLPMHARSLAAAQTTPRRGDVEANVTQHVELARLAAASGAEVVVFPELSLIGYELDLGPVLAFSEDDPRLEPLRQAASEARLTLVVGAPIRLESGLHIGAFLIAPDGSVDVYTKHHLAAFEPADHPEGPIPPSEGSVFVPGARNPLLPCGLGHAAVAVCADTSHPEHAAAAAERGATTYLAGSFVIPRDLPRVKERLGSYALRHGMATVLANYGGPSGGLPSAGSSGVWSEQGKRVVELPETGAGLALARETPDGWVGRVQML